jgi:hypothetical protein
MLITVDSRGCGLGKTTNKTNGIYSYLNKHMDNNENVLVVVPSIELQHQYIKEYPFMKCINSNNNENTSLLLLDEFRNNTKYIIITHETFVKISSYGYTRKYHLIIDEALENIFRITKISNLMNEKWKPNLRFEELFTPFDEYNEELFKSNDPDVFIKMRNIGDNKFIFNDSQIFRNITHMNYNLYLTHRDWDVLNGNSEVINGIIISELDTSILGNWKSIHISAANFETTSMCYWLKKYNIDYDIIHPFTIHVGNVTLHVPNIKWSKYKLTNHPEIHKRYLDYVNNTSTNGLLCVRNNSLNDNLLTNEVRLSHNVHGMNNYRNYNDISLESALVPHPMFSSFLTQIYGMDKKEIIRAYSTYKFYQIIMRTSLRTNSNSPINIFMLDISNAELLFDYIAIKNYVDIPIQYEVNKEIIKVLTKEEKKELKKQQNREYSKRYRDKKKKSNNQIGTQ